jgi:hypothetical protein
MEKVTTKVATKTTEEEEEEALKRLSRGKFKRGC